MWSPTYSSDELMHHGVLGMKWGVRRYQNEDGTLTSAGKKRYLKEMKRDMKSHYENQVGKRVSKHLRINNNFTESAGSSAGKAYRKGELTSKDYKAASKARSATKQYMIDKYGEDAVKALAKSGVLGRKIDDFTPKQLSSGKSKVNSIVSNTSFKVPSGALQEKPRTYNPKTGKMEDTKHKKSNVIYGREKKSLRTRAGEMYVASTKDRADRAKEESRQVNNASLAPKAYKDAMKNKAVDRQAKYEKAQRDLDLYKEYEKKKKQH